MAIKLEGIHNPFRVFVPDELEPKDADYLWCDNNRYERLVDPNNTFLNGPRGCGKSMLFRVLENDVQRLRLKSLECERRFTSIYVPVKSYVVVSPEFAALRGKQSDYYINEHILCLHVLSALFSRPERIFDEQELSSEEWRAFVDSWNAFHKENLATKDLVIKFDGLSVNAETVCRQFTATLEKLVSGVQHYARTVLDEQLSYTDSLATYDTGILKAIELLQHHNLIARDHYVYLLLDDADELNLTQTEILNSWIGRRSGKLFFKVSTQLGYKTFRTSTGRVIQRPHDYEHIDIWTTYTRSGFEEYQNLIADIVTKRLILKGINKTPQEYFPLDPDQEKKILDLKQGIAAEAEKEGMDRRKALDHAYRIVESEYLKQLGGLSKSSHTYKYCGFDTLVDVSSCLVRNFLEAAAQMYLFAKADQGRVVQQIPPEVQDAVLRLNAYKEITDEPDEVRAGFYYRFDSEDPASQRDSVALMNLVKGLGGLFQKMLLSDRSERRYFSVAFQDRPSEYLKKILDLGVQRGLFQRGFVGDKEGITKRPLYIMTRTLAPAFKLIVKSYAGHLSISSASVEQFLYADVSLPTMINKLYKSIVGAEYGEQQGLFEDSEEIF